MTRRNKWLSLPMAVCLLTPVIFATLSLIDSPLHAQEAEMAVETVTQTPAEATGVSDEMFTVNNVWMMVSTFLVFIMHLGFAMIESGLTQAKNTVNILFKNTMIVAIGLLTYALMGFNLMYPGDVLPADQSNWIIFWTSTVEGQKVGHGLLGFAGFGLSTDAAGLTQNYNTGYTYWTDFLF